MKEKRIHELKISCDVLEQETKGWVKIIQSINEGLWWRVSYPSFFGDKFCLLQLLLFLKYFHIIPQTRLYSMRYCCRIPSFIFFMYFYYRPMLLLFIYVVLCCVVLLTLRLSSKR